MEDDGWKNRWRPKKKMEGLREREHVIGYRKGVSSKLMSDRGE